jgi:cytochrome c oxidase assembly protein Cox11
MKRLIIAILISSFAAAPVYAQTCQAVSADGKPLTGAAKTSHMKKCCEDSAKSADGKVLSGAAKTSYVNKCMKG